MKITPLAKVSQDVITFSVSEIEAILQAPLLDVPPFAPRSVILSSQSGEAETMLIRPARREEAPSLLRFISEKFFGAEDLDQAPDFTDLIGARVYAEVLGWYRARLKDSYNLLALSGGELIGLANGRLMNEEININLHTLAFDRDHRIEAALYCARCQYCFEDLGQDELWSAFESYDGWKHWGVGMAQPSYPWPDLQHELGGGRVYYLTRKYWESTVRGYLAENYGIRIEREVSPELMAENESIKFPPPPAPEPVEPETPAPADPVSPEVGPDLSGV